MNNKNMELANLNEAYDIIMDSLMRLIAFDEAIPYLQEFEYPNDDIAAIRKLVNCKNAHDSLVLGAVKMQVISIYETRLSEIG